jgi:membrane-associated protein
VLLPAFDAVIPILPSETAIIALGVATAGSADPRIFLLVALAAVGAFLGDNLCYYLGHRFGAPVERRFLSGEKGTKARAWAEQALDRFGARLIIACRFVPGGRTAVMLTCGLIGYPRRIFVPATAAAGVIWASYAFLIGRLGGAAFEHRPWIGLVLAFGIALAVSGLIELVRRTGLWPRMRRLLGRHTRAGGTRADDQDGGPADRAVTGGQRPQRAGGADADRQDSGPAERAGPRAQLPQRAGGQGSGRP